MLANDLYLYVLEMLSASHESCERISLFQKPSKQFIIGSLADSSKDYAVGEGIGENKVQAKSALRHNSMGIIFLLEKSKLESISVKISCSVFYRVFPTYDEQLGYTEEFKDDQSVKRDPGFKEVYVRKNCMFEPSEFGLDKDKEIETVDFSIFKAEILNEDELFRSNKNISDALERKKIRNGFDPIWITNEDDYNGIIIELKKNPSSKTLKWQGEIIVEKEDYSHDLSLITIWFRNITGKGSFEKFFFNCKLEVELNSNNLVPFEYKYNYEDYNYNKMGNLRTINCHAFYNPDSNIIITKPYAIFEQEKKIPRTSVEGIEPRFEFLEGSTDILKQLLTELKNQYSRYTNHEIYKNKGHEHNKQFVKESDNFGFLVERYEAGTLLLDSNPKAKKAFFLMNRAFGQAVKNEYANWRLFQIIFIVMVIPEIIDIKKNRNIADIIHVDTGGGKSEAYFGLVVFLLFWDRLRGKDQGVSGITKFPLRMLSIQQLQRIAKVIVIAEEVRKAENIEGTPFSVGYYVGVSDEFPRHTRPIIEKIQKAERKGEKISGMLLEKCPLCGSNVYLRVDTIRLEGDEEKETPYRVLHVCGGCNKDFYLYFTNSEIYRLLPSFIVSTVDKLASVALNRRFKSLMGGKLSVCSNGHGFVPINDKCDFEIGNKRTCKGTAEPFDNIIEGPTLMIQDEMHLIREGFGTIDSHFESLLNTLLKKFSDKEFKYITMTATVSGAKEQIDNLYLKNHFVFPGKVPRDYKEDDDFFFEYEKDNNGNPKIQRIIIGLKPNLRDNQFASLLTIFHIISFLEMVSVNRKTYSEKYKISDKELSDELRKYQCLLTYHDKKADVYSMSYFIHTVVTSKLENYDISKKTLTGDNTLDDIKKTILEIETFSKQKENDKKVHTTFATSVVSHGVDINNWNLMIFQGMTRNTSEYIQALSRVGRRYLGVIFLWFYPNRVRDLSYYKNFNLFHDILQQKVEKTPISRWAKLGFKQTFTSIFCAAILNYISNEIESPLYTVEAVNNYFQDDKNKNLLFQFIKEAYYSKNNKVGSDWFHSNINSETEKRLNYLKKYSNSAHKNFFPNALRDSDHPYFKTQYGMRGIQDEIVLRLNDEFGGFVEKYQRGED
ncbi:hypothetical protein LCGC14_1097230 [marine sediment metagenome]|uniref:Helicase C-terminal domain-containing protein n=1 Tax=marine sediment metagenome TaxID=412755 RepID=A0A0F9QGM5_9ZZZZ|nr:hypothetical protein [bacterium]